MKRKKKRQFVSCCVKNSNTSEKLNLRLGEELKAGEERMLKEAETSLESMKAQI